MLVVCSTSDAEARCSLEQQQNKMRRNFFLPGCLTCTYPHMVKLFYSSYYYSSLQAFIINSIQMFISKRNICRYRRTLVYLYLILKFNVITSTGSSLLTEVHSRLHSMKSSGILKLLYNYLSRLI